MMESLSVALGEAPGRLDLLGGVADYSGAMVLEVPIAAATRVMVHALDAAVLRLCSAENGLAETDAAPLWNALDAGAGLEALRAALDAADVPTWTRYPLGCLLVFCRAKRWRPSGGLAFDIVSSVPQSMGVSSSAALEIATLRALASLAGLGFVGLELAHLGQLAENRMVGAPCGLMDQLTCAYGPPGHLLPILCRPDQIQEPIPLPEDVLVVGWPSGVKHSVGGSPYGRARAAAFMGKRIIERHTGRTWKYAAEIPPSFLARGHEGHLLRTMRGADYLAAYDGVDDPLSRIDEHETYPVRAALEFPVQESFRAQVSSALLRGINDENRTDVLRQVGELMLQSHAGYSAMGLGTEETDRMVDAVIEAGPERGLYGARASGGGCGGTVVVLLERRGLPALAALAEQLYFVPDGPLPLIR